MGSPIELRYSLFRNLHLRDAKMQIRQRFDQGEPQ